MRRPLLLTWALLCPLLTTGPAAEPGEVRIRSGPYTGYRVSVQSDLVEVGATVRDRHGNAVGGLQSSDFSITDRGHPQTITVFREQRSTSGAGAHPDRTVRTIALFFDDTHAGTYDLQKARMAAEQLIATGMLPGDRIGVFTESGDPAVNFTDDVEALTQALGNLRQHRPSGPSSLGVCPEFSPYAAFTVSHNLDPGLRQGLIARAVACNCGGDEPACAAQQPSVVDSQAIQFWQQFQAQSAISLDVIQLAVRRLAAEPGSRILVLFSPGYFTSELDLRKSEIVDQSLRGRITISGLNAAGLQTFSRRAADSALEFMKGAVSATGGQFVDDTNDALGGLKRLLAVPEVTYTLGFSPDTPPDGRFHPLAVSLRHPGQYRIDARTGYVSAAPDNHGPSAQERIDRAVQSENDVAEIAARAEVTAASVKNGLARVQIRVAVDANQLKFAERDGRFVQQLTFVTVVEDSRGSAVGGKQSVMDLALTSKTLAELRSQGLMAATTFTLPAGPYRVREVVREAVGDRMASSRTPFQVR